MPVFCPHISIHIPCGHRDRNGSITHGHTDSQWVRLRSMPKCLNFGPILGYFGGCRWLCFTYAPCINDCCSLCFSFIPFLKHPHKFQVTGQKSQEHHVPGGGYLSRTLSSHSCNTVVGFTHEIKHVLCWHNIQSHFTGPPPQSITSLHQQPERAKPPNRSRSEFTSSTTTCKCRLRQITQTPLHPTQILLAAFHLSSSEHSGIWIPVHSSLLEATTNRAVWNGASKGHLSGTGTGMALAPALGITHGPRGTWWCHGDCPKPSSAAAVLLQRCCQRPAADISPLTAFTPLSCHVSQEI